MYTISFFNHIDRYIINGDMSMKKGKWNMYDIILKEKKQNIMHKTSDNIFLSTPQRTKEDNIQLIISRKIEVSLSRDMEKFTRLMVQCIMEGFGDE